MSAKYCPECGRNYEGCTACDPPTVRPMPTPPPVAVTDLREQCVSEEPISGKRCTFPANHDVHRKGGTAWSTDHEAWCAEMAAKDTEMRRLRRKVEREQTLAKMAEQHAAQAEATNDRVTAANDEMSGWDDPTGIAAQYGAGIGRALTQPGDQPKDT